MGSFFDTHTFELPGISLASFLDLYDLVLAGLASGKDSPQSTPWHRPQGGCIVRRTRSSHSSSSRLFSELAVEKTMAVYVVSSEGEGAAPGRLVVLEANYFRGALYSDFFVVVARWSVSTEAGSDTAVVQLTTGLGFLKETMLRSTVDAEFRRGARVAAEGWEGRARLLAPLRTPSVGSRVAVTTLLESPGAELEGSVAAAVEEPDLRKVFDPETALGAQFAQALADGDGNKHDDSSRKGDQGALVIGLASDTIEGFICPTCGQINSSQGGLVAHYAAFHGATEKGAPLDESSAAGASCHNLSQQLSSDAEAAGFVCPECFKTFPGPADLVDHFDRDHGGTTKRAQVVESPGKAKEERVPESDVGYSVMDTVASVALLFSS